jgi:hypothetical protein
MEVNSSELVANVAASAAENGLTPSVSPSSSYTSTTLKNLFDATKKVKLLQQQEIEMSNFAAARAAAIAAGLEPTTSNYDLNSETQSSSNRNSVYMNKSNSTTGVNNISKESPHTSKHSDTLELAPKKKKRVKLQTESSDLSLGSVTRRVNHVRNLFLFTFNFFN